MGLIRLLLAVSVIISHSNTILGLDFVGGDTAVKTFYIISGFYMSLILNEKYVNQKHAYRLFISNRFLRLFPIYWTVLTLTLLFSFVVCRYATPNQAATNPLRMYVENFSHINGWSFSFLIFTNLFLFFQDTVMFLGLDTHTGNLFFTSNYRQTSPELFLFLFVPQAWTIGVELMFYLVAPFLVRRNAAIVSGIILASLLLRATLYHNGLHHDPWTYRFFPTELAFFLLGNISYVMYKKIQTVQLKSFQLNALWLAATCAIVCFSMVEFPFKKIIYFAFFCISLPFIFQKTQKSKMDSYIGDLSYPMYMCHMFLLSVLWSFNLGAIKWLGLVLTVSSILFSVFINEVVAKPIEKFRQSRVRSTGQTIEPK